ncbi:MAG: 3-oxoacyl-[acyl-carrier protein] reductase [Pseudonocardiales bacterium]|jgi:3-oxoacyl-[acyl-carrier protein] reductase|nr:3-oxoacyl-[acyl-carrier protein] reductase [Pseudonocardiales bacterium]
MDLGLSGRVAAVAGSSSGLGLAAAKALAAEGAHVAICGRNAEKLARAEAEVAALGPGRVTSTALDLRNDSAAAGWIEDTASAMGGLDIVITNSGGVPGGPVDDFVVDDYRKAFETSMLPHVSLTLAALPLLKKRGWGRILMVASEVVRQPNPDYGLSAVARLGILGYMKGLVDALGDSGVTVNVLAPGYHRTAMLTSQFGDDVEDELAKVAEHIPLGRIGDPADFGALAAFYSSRQARFITGTVIMADGGNTRGVS